MDRSFVVISKLVWSTLLCFTFFFFNNYTFGQAFNWHFNSDRGEIWGADNDNTDLNEDFIWVHNRNSWTNNTGTETMRLSESALSLVNAFLYTNRVTSDLGGVSMFSKGRIWSAAYGGVNGGMWVNSINNSPTQFFGSYDNTSKMGLFNNGWRLVADNAGNVGIGTATPGSTLSVNGTAFFNGAGSGDTHIPFGNGEIYLTPKSNLYIRNIAGNVLTTFDVQNSKTIFNGNVGIGTATPNAAFQLGNAINNRRIVLWEDGNNDHQFYGFGINPSTLRYQSMSNHVFYAASSPTNSMELMRIQGNGNVGIGTPSADNPLHIYKYSGVLLDLEVSGTDSPLSQGDIQFSYNGGDPNNKWYFGRISGIKRPGGGGHLAFSTGNGTDERMRIAYDGNVGIGTATPTEKLDVNGSFRAKKAIIGSLNFATHVRDTLEDATGISYYLWVEKGVVAEDFAIVAKEDWDDYVFNEDYKLPTLEKVAAFVKANKHLPNIPSEAEVKRNGYTVHQLNRGFLKTIEELTLYTIEQHDKIKALEEKVANYDQLATEVAQLKAHLQQFSDLEQRIKQLEAKK